MIDYFPQFQLLLLDETGHVVAIGHTHPLFWDGTLEGLPIGWNTAFVRAVEGHEAGITPTTLSAVEAAIDPAYQGQGISYQIMAAMRATAIKHSLNALIAPVRPSQKARYPLVPMGDYMNWRREDDLFFDPWLRAHQRMGAELLKEAAPSMHIQGTIAEWESWTGMRFMQSGSYIVEGALCPVEIDCEADVGLYLEPNVWMHHPITTEKLTKGKK
ncbi:MAG: hypothetical protein KAG66_04810 [Methylococcales bacterium]|nr:hypothetical protein [Methylococcales bacterium]